MVSITARKLRYRHTGVSSGIAMSTMVAVAIDGGETPITKSR
jgi:hypothetical protein